MMILSLSFMAGGWIAPWISFPGFSFRAIPDLTGQVAIVSGSNTGIGFVTARELARKGANVVVAARSAEKGNDAVARINKAIQGVKGAGSAVFLPLDLNSFENVRKFASNFRGKFSRLDMLVLNAGVWPNKYSSTADGYEQTIGVNHLAHFLLVKMLMPLIRLSKTRVVTVSSALEKQSYPDGIRFDTFKYDPAKYEKSYFSLTSYGHSKLANVLFSHELARRLNGTGATANVIHPGIIVTELHRDMHHQAFPMSTLYSIFNEFYRLATMSVDNGALTQLFAATSPKLAGVTGRFFVPIALDRTASGNPHGLNATLAKLLWEESERMVR